MASPSPSDLAADGKTVTVVVCRLGNDSQIAADALRAAGEVEGNSALKNVVDLVGGLRKWAKDIDPKFPVY